MKTGPLSNVEKFYIKNHWKVDAPEKIAKDMDRSLRMVNRYISECKLDDEDQISVKNNMNNDSDKGVAIMTSEASELSDAIRKSGGKITAQNRPDCVAKIR